MYSLDHSSQSHASQGPVSGSPVPAQSWELPWQRSYDLGVPLSLQYPDEPLYTLLEATARDHPQLDAAICFESQIKYGELLTKARQFGHALRELGVRRGDRVGLLLPNVPEYPIAIHGVWMLGAAAVQFSPLMVEDEIAKILDMTGTRIMVTLDMLTPLMAGLRGRGRIDHLIVTSLEQRLGIVERWLYPIERFRRGAPLRSGKTNGWIEFDSLIASQPTHQVRARIEPHRDAAVIQPTGGTTGSPKAVVLTHRNLMANALQLKAWDPRKQGHQTVLAVVPFFHCYGLTVVMLASIACGYTMVMCPKFKPATLAKLIRRHRPTLLPAVPALYVAMNQYMEKKPVDLSSIELSFSAASGLPAQVRREFESHGAKKLIEAYGLSEASPATHVNPIISGGRPGTVGLPLPDTLARIVDLETNTKDLGPGQTGELAIRGPQVMAGYLDDAVATAAAIRDGWLFTGDIASYDADGYFRIVDRKKDLIKTSGYNVFPIEVEDVIRKHSGVADVSVVGVPDVERGELVKAFVIPKPDSGLSVAALEQYCREHLAKHKQPRQIELCQDLPRNFLGKVLRRRLREQ